MTSDSFEPKEQSKGSVPPASRGPIAAPKALPAEPQYSANDYAEPERGFHAGPVRSESPSVASPRDLRLVGFLVAFAVGAAATLAVFAALAFGLAGSYGDRILPGVHAGAADLSGLTRDQAITKLQTEFTGLSHGEVTVTTPVGVATITYQQAGRSADVEAMADAAMSVGHSGSPIADASSVIHSAAFGTDIPVVIQVNPTALAQRIQAVVGTSSVAPQDAQVSAKSGTFTVVPSAAGRGVDEKAIGALIISELTDANAPADLQAGGAFVTISPQVTDTAAQDAIARAQKMIVNVNLTWQTAPAGAPTTWKAQSWTITAAQIRSWIVFGRRDDGTYAPAVDPAQVGSYLAGITAKAEIPPTEPNVIWDSTHTKPIGLTSGKDGVGVDLGATTTALSAYLDSLATGATVGPSLEVVTAPIHPQIADVSTVAGMVLIGSQTIYFFPDVSNGNGANIRVPAKNLNGQVIGPGQPFSFLQAVGPIDAAHGFAMGGVILHGQSDHTGAMGGGICSASTTMFDAAANAGLQIDERHAHFYYISRYPVGKDATVYSNGTTTWDLRWTNDTPNPIVIRSWATYGSQSSITIQLWSMPLNRKVVWPAGVKTDIVKATSDPIRYVKTLKPGVKYIAEYPDDGFKTTTTRTVTDSNGTVLHHDTWISVYGVVNGQVQMGGTPAPSGGSPTPSGGTPTPTGSHTPAPTPTPSAPPPTPAPTPTPAASRRRKVLS
jgi:vancomycin resistance protein YoaR